MSSAVNLPSMHGSGCEGTAKVLPSNSAVKTHDRNYKSGSIDKFVCLLFFLLFWGDGGGVRGGGGAVHQESSSN